jgi:hypothetical protein
MRLQPVEMIAGQRGKQCNIPPDRVVLPQGWGHADPAGDWTTTVLPRVRKQTTAARPAPGKAAFRPAGTVTRFGCRKHYIEPVVICWSCDMTSRPRDLADRMAGRRKLDDGYLRETFTLPRDKARARARDFLACYPKAAYMSGVESWRELPDGDIEFTMRRLRSAD